MIVSFGIVNRCNSVIFCNIVKLRHCERHIKTNVKTISTFRSQLEKIRTTSLLKQLSCRTLSINNLYSDDRNKSWILRCFSSIKDDKSENIKTIPNLISALRLVSAPVLSYLLVHELFVPALVIFSLAALSDLIDGFIARRFEGQSSSFGTILDPFADKVFVSVLAVSIAYMEIIPVWLVCIYLLRDIGLILYSLVVRYDTLHPPRTISKYFDLSVPTVTVHPSIISKINTFFQLTVIGAGMLSPVFDFVNHPFLIYLWYTSASTTVLSGLDYWLKKKSYTVL